MKKIILALLVWLTSSILLTAMAAVSLKPLPYQGGSSNNAFNASYVIEQEHFNLTMDGYDADWDTLGDVGIVSVQLSDVGIELKTLLSEQIQVMEENRSFKLRSPRRYYFLKVKKSSQFDLKNAKIITSYKDIHGNYKKRDGSRSLRTISINQSVSSCNYNEPKVNRWTLKTEDLPLNLSCPETIYSKRVGMIREDKDYLYFEFYVVEPQTTNEKQYTIPVITLLAANKKAQAAAMAAICAPNCPNPEDWYGETKAAIQIGISVQVPFISGQASFVSDLNQGIYPSASLGAAPRNRDVELEAFVVFYNTDDLDKIVNGTSATITKDFGRIYGVGLISVTNSDVDVFGVGATIGVIGVPDSDISLSYGFEPNPGTIPNSPLTGGSNGKSGSDRNTGGFGPNDGADPNDDSWSMMIATTIAGVMMPIMKHMTKE
ncbi:hypothetical protein JCM19239_1509 [Vibrio variabilis]|uniref:Uncharacterized protein n=1 Tax=Vibrio variabilis TaxID=990271 RepID=A0ABQ0JGC4_9VIBR|nr:hypothetical protein JCM19239_1509 [Vibrio variabilis]